MKFVDSFFPVENRLQEMIEGKLCVDASNSIGCCLGFYLMGCAIESPDLWSKFFALRPNVDLIWNQLSICEHQDWVQHWLPNLSLPHMEYMWTNLDIVEKLMACGFFVSNTFLVQELAARQRWLFSLRRAWIVAVAE